MSGHSTAGRLHRVIAFVKLGRYLFAGAGFFLYGFGAALAQYLGHHIDWTLYLWGQAIVTSTQVMVHYANDYYDFLADSANQTPTDWSGGSRILQQGLLPLGIALTTARLLGATALLLSLGLLLRFEAGPLSLPILLSAIVLSWNYSAPPLHLNRHGLGELTGVLVVAFLTPLTGYYLQAGELQAPALLALLPLLPLQANMLFSVNLPDIEGDLLVQKRTLVARLGRHRVARLYQGMLLLSYLGLPLLVALGLPPRIALGAALPLPLALYLFWRMARGDWQQVEQWNSLAFQSIALLMATLIGELLSVLR